MKKSVIQKLRIPLTNIFVVLLLIFIATSDRPWEVKHPLFTSFLFFMGLFFVGIGSLGRLWCSLYIAGWKTKVLITKGPYSMCRNPLYFFSFIGAIGVGFATETILIPFFVVILFAAYYPYVIRKEENKLLTRHGQQFKSYSESVPRFFPRLSNFTEPQEYIVNPIIFKTHIFSALWFIWMIGILEILEKLHELGMIPVMFMIY